MNRLTANQRRWNRQTAGHGALAADHRRRVMHLIESSAPAAGGRVCVLGAGNANDLNLPRLVARCAEVALVDIDGQALEQAALRQGVQDAASLKLHGGCNLTDVWDDLDRAAAAADDEALLDDLIRRAANPAVDMPSADFDVVISTCVLSQLLKGVIDALGETHPRFLDLLAAVRLGHMRLMLDRTAPGGSTILVTDFVSSDSAPVIATTPEEQLGALARELVAQRNFFHGLNPAVLAHLWQSDAVLSSAAERVEVAQPWRWNFGIRQYLVAAFVVKKRKRPMPS